MKNEIPESLQTKLAIICSLGRKVHSIDSEVADEGNLVHLLDDAEVVEWSVAKCQSLAMAAKAELDELP